MATPATEVDADGQAVRVSSPDRVIYPATESTPEVTKLQVVEYYLSVGDGIMRALRRPARRRSSAGRAASTRASSSRPVAATRATRSTASGSQGRSGVRRDDAGGLPERPYRRRGVRRQPGHGRLVRPDGHDHLPPVADPQRRQRPSRRAAHRPRPAARHHLHRRRPRGRGGPRAARGARHHRLPEDQRQPRRAHLRAHRAALGLRRRAARRDRVRSRAGEARRGGHHEVVEGGARRAHLRRLQPELPRPDHRLGVLAAPACPVPRPPPRSPGTSWPG